MGLSLWPGYPTLVHLSLHWAYLTYSWYLSACQGGWFYDPVYNKLYSLSRFLTQSSHLSTILLPGASTYVADTVDCHFQSPFFLAETASRVPSILLCTLQ